MRIYQSGSVGRQSSNSRLCRASSVAICCRDGGPQRRMVLAGILGSWVTLNCAVDRAHALPIAVSGSQSARIVHYFNKNLVEDDMDLQWRIWTEVIERYPGNIDAFINRGYASMRSGRWELARKDLRYALKLASDGNSSKELQNVLLSLGTVEGACGDWSQAVKIFTVAAGEPSQKCQAQSKLALALFEVGKESAAIAQLQSLVQTEPECMDNRAALASLLWAKGYPRQAEKEWKRLQVAQNGLGGKLYATTCAMQQVQGRWPPRAVAALDALIKQSPVGQSLAMDGALKIVQFRDAHIA